MTDLIRRADVLKLLNDEADKCDDAARWGGSKQYVRACRDAAYAIRDRAAAITKMPAAPDLHRSFPEAGDGRPLPPMGDELMTASLSAEDARFVAVQLAQNGWTLTPTAVDASQAADPAVNAPAEDAHAKGETDGEVLERLGMDGAEWAAEFRITALRLGYSDMDEGWLIGWFANAIMAGYDRKPDPAAIREAALREAAAILRREIERVDAIAPEKKATPHRHDQRKVSLSAVASEYEEIEQEILALIPKGADHE